MARVTRSRFMPPWQADGPVDAFVGHAWPSESELTLFEQWAIGGTAEGDGPMPPTSPQPADAWRLGQPDLVVAPSEAYTLAAGGTDVFRIFVVPIPVSVARFVRGLEFVPGNPLVVHHANIRIDRTPASRDLDRADSAPGYDGLLARSALFPDGHFLGWTPGQAAPLLPKGLAWRLDPGADLVLQLHMQPSGKPEQVLPQVGFFFGSDPPDRVPTMIRLGRQNIDIPAGERDYTVTDSYTLPVDVEVQAVQPHAHYRAREVRGVATLPGGQARELITIRNWDFRWQHLYRYKAPFWLPRGTVLSMSYSYDNSAGNARNPVRPPERVVWGQRSAEEMGDLWIQVLTRNRDDDLVLNRDFRPKAVREDLVGYEALIARTSAAAGLHEDAALLHLELGDPGEAAAHFGAAATLRPGVATAPFNLGTTLAAAGRVEEAVEAFRSALAIDPGYARAHYSLGVALRTRGDWTGARASLREAVRLSPEWIAATIDLAWILSTAPDQQAGDAEEAIALAARAVALTTPRDPAILDVLGVAYAAAGRYAEAVAAAEAALAEHPAPDLAADIRSRLALYRGAQPYRR